MNDLAPTEFDVAYFIRVVSSGAGDGQISASRLAQNRVAVQRATEALREFADQLKGPNRDAVLNAYAELAPEMPHLFSPLWVADLAPAMTAAALECIALAAGIRIDVRRAIVRGRASALHHVLKNNSRFLAKRVLNILSAAARKTSILASAIARRFDLTNETPSLTQKHNRVCKLPFLRLINTLLASGDRNTIRILATSSKAMFLAGAGIVHGIMREEVRDFDDVERVKRAKIVKSAEQKHTERHIAKERNEALTGALWFIHNLRDQILNCKNEYLIRSAFEPPFLDRLASIAAVHVPLKLTSQNDRRHKEVRDTARTVLFSVAKNRRILRPYVIARSLSDTGVAASGDALSLVTDTLRECPHLARYLLQNGPFLPSQPQPTTAWLSNAAVVMACVRRLTRPTDAFRTNNFFERTLNHGNRLVRHVGAVILARLCAISENSEDATDILPPFALFQKVFIRNEYDWDKSIHTLFATYARVAANEIAAENLDPVFFAVRKAGKNVAMAEPTIRRCLESAKEQTLDTIFKEKVFGKLVLISECNQLSKAILEATGLFSSESDTEMEVWLSFIRDEECATKFENMVSSARKQPFILFDDAGSDVSLLAAKAMQILSKRKDTGKFEKYLAGVVSALVAWETILGRDAMKSLVKRKLGQCQEIIDSIPDDDDLMGAVVLLEKSNMSNSPPAVKEICSIGRFLAELYYGDCNAGELDNIWSECCTQFEQCLKLENRFFEHHISRLTLRRTDQTFRSYLWLLRMRQSHYSGDEIFSDSISVEERAVFLRIFLRDGKFLHETINFVLDSGLQNCDIIDVFEEALLNAIEKTQKIEQVGVERLVKKSLRTCTEKCGEDSVIVNSYARFVFRIIVAFLNHNDSTVRQSCSAAINVLDGEQQIRLSRLGLACIEPFIGVLDKVRALIPPCARFVKNMIEEETLWSKSIQVMPLMSFLVSAKEADESLGEQFLAKVSLAHPWSVSHHDESSMTIIQEKGFDLGASIGKRLPIGDTLDILLEHGPDSDVGSALAWWCIACGVLSTSTKHTTVDHECEQKARKLTELIASQIGSMNPAIMNCVHRGPLEVIMWLLYSTNLPTTHVAHGTEGHNFANNLCAFVSSVFKQLAVAQMQAIGAHIPVEREIKALQKLYVVLKCASIGVSVPEIGLNLSRQVLHTFSENLRCLESIGDVEYRIESKTRSLCENVLDVFIDIVMKCTKSLQAVGMDARSAVALTNMEKLFCNPLFTFFASRSQFDQKVLQSMKRIKSCMQKDDFRRQRQLPNLRSGLFSPLAANVAPMLNAERLKATATFILRQLQQPTPRPKSAFPTSLSETDSMPYEPTFALRTMRLACEYAAYTKEATVLDLNTVVNGGLLRVAFVGIASEDEQVRIQAYAALDALSRVIGPEYGNAKESAAALYVNRRPLALVLNMLKDSIDEPMKQVLPMFSSWLWHVLKILVRPSQKAYVGVMRMVLRSPVWDVDDCVGVVYLMKGTEVGVDAVALRYLALDVIEEGLWSRKDHIVARKRRLYDYLVILAGSSIGIDGTVRDKALRVLTQIAGRFPAGQVAIQLCRMHSFASCMMPQMTDETEMKVQHLMNRIDGVKEVARMLPKDYEMKSHARCLAGSFVAIARALQTVCGDRMRDKDIVRIRECQEVLVGLGEKGQEWCDRWLRAMREGE